MATRRAVHSLQTAVAHHQAGRLPEAERGYRLILSGQPRHPDALHLLGVIFYQRGEHQQAVDAIAQALRLSPRTGPFYSNYGRALQALHRYEDALQAYRCAIELNAGTAEAHLNSGNVLQQLGRLSESAAHYQAALTIEPRYAEAHNNLGNALCHDNPPEAAASYRRALNIQPDLVSAHNNLGNALQRTGQAAEALLHLSRAIELEPGYAEAYYNLGFLHQSQMRLQAAEASYRKALQLAPDHGKAWNNLGNALREQGRVEESIECYRRVDFASAHSNLLLTAHYSPAWSPPRIAAEHIDWGRRYAEPLRAFYQPHKNKREPNRKLRIGYVSADFRTHPVAFFLRPLAMHDPAHFDVFCYSDVQHPDAMTAHLRSTDVHWRDVVTESDESLAEQIRSDEIDILIDLAGHTSGNRLLVFARKPAPVAVTWLGYPDTTGLAAIDYRLTDHWADPPGQTEAWHTETLVRLPDGFSCWTPPVPGPEPGELPARRNGYVTFGSFNNWIKVTGEAIAMWAAILEHVKGSRLLLKSASLADEETRRRAFAAFAAQGIEAGRIELRAATHSLAAHFETYRQVDIALDTFPYNGTTTTCEALWMGVPVMALAGQTHASRVGVSLLSRVSLTDYLATDAGEYVQIAARHAGNLTALSSLRHSLRGRLASSSIMQAAAFTVRLENAYRTMWTDWCRTTG